MMPWEKVEAIQAKFLMKLAKKAPITTKKLGRLGCGAGWHRIIEELVLGVERVLAEDPKLANELSFGIKEKYARLTVHAQPHDARIDALIAEAEQKASETCEDCGEPGRWHMSINQWESIACEKHAPKVEACDHDM